MEERPLVRQQYKLERIPGKGGWTYAIIPEIPKDKNAPFGWVRVKGSIDSYEISQYHLMPLKNGHLFLPINAGIRKKIKKQAGDTVMITLYPDYSKFEVPEEFATCLIEAPEAQHTFYRLSEGKQREIVSHIYKAKLEETRINRIVKAIQQLSEPLKYGTY